MFYQSRWYDPSLGRMAQADTIVPGGVQGLDRYAYVNNSPLNYVDPSGHFGQCHDGQSGYQCRMTLINAWRTENRQGGSVPIPPESAHGLCEEIGTDGSCLRRTVGWYLRYDPQGGIEKAIEEFGLGIPKEADITYDSTLEGDDYASTSPMENGRIHIRIGPHAFSSWGWLGSTINHELCHAKQQLGPTCHTYLGRGVRSRHNFVKTVGERKKWYFTQGGYLNEVEAYDLELATANFFGLTVNEIAKLQSRRLFYYIELHPVNQSRARQHNYHCEITSCTELIPYP